MTDLWILLACILALLTLYAVVRVFDSVSAASKAIRTYSTVHATLWLRVAWLYVVLTVAFGAGVAVLVRAIGQAA